MNAAATHRLLPALRTTLVADAVFELLAGVALAAPGSPVGSWLNLSPRASTVLGAVSLAAGVWIAMLLRTDPPNARIVRALAIGNLAGGTVAWILVIALWPRLAPLGRAALGAAGDICILLGILEIL